MTPDEHGVSFLVDRGLSLERRDTPAISDPITSVERIRHSMPLLDGQERPFIDAITATLIFAAGMCTAYILSHVGG